jgi:hypothetical protein
MHIKGLLAGAAFAIVTLTGAGAQAGTVFQFTGPTPEYPTDSSVAGLFLAPSGPGTATFTIDGYASLDGQNFYEDDFSFSVNGSPVLVGTFNLGGGGNDVLYTAPAGTTAVNLNGYTPGDISFAGGKELITVPVNLAAGLNIISFAYTSLTDGHAGFQGLGDEGWGLENISVTSGVPEPATWAMMLVGFGGLGAAMRSARRSKVVAA